MHMQFIDDPVLPVVTLPLRWEATMYPTCYFTHKHDVQNTCLQKYHL